MQSTLEAFTLFDKKHVQRIPMHLVEDALKYLGLNPQWSHSHPTTRTMDLINFRYCVRALLWRDRSIEGQVLPETRMLMEQLDADDDGRISSSDVDKLLASAGLQLPPGAAETIVGARPHLDIVELDLRLRQLQSEAQPFEALRASLEEDLEKAEVQARVRELVGVVKDKLRTAFQEGTIAVSKEYWLETDGLLVHRIPASAAAGIGGTGQEAEEEALEFEGRVYSVKLDPYRKAWLEGSDADGQRFSAKMDFSQYFEARVWPGLTPAERESLSDNSVHFMSPAEARQWVVDRTVDGRLVNQDGGKLGPGLCMTVLAKDGTLFCAPKVRGRRHHTSFTAGAPVRAAAMLVLDEAGGLLTIIARSGHYKPKESAMRKLVLKFQELGVNLSGVVLTYHDTGREMKKGEGDRDLTLHRSAFDQMQIWRAIKARPQLPPV